MKRMASIMPVLLLAFVVSCQKSDKDKLVGTWVCEIKDAQNRWTLYDDGTYRLEIYKCSGEQEQRSAYLHRYSQATGKDATMYRSWGLIGKWRVENGAISLSEKGKTDKTETCVFSELTPSRLVLGSKADYLKPTYIKLQRWNSMTDAEILAYHKENEKNHPQKTN